MLVNLKEILAEAKREGRAVGAFNVVDCCSGRAITAAAEELNSPVILMFAEVHRDLVPLKLVGELMLSLAKDAKVPVCVHLDHGTDLDYIRSALDMGFTSVMYDGSALPYEENLRNSATVAEYAHSRGASIEAELGKLPNREGESGGHNQHADYTNPAQAREFVEKTGVDALAIAFGTAHGVYEKPPVLSFDIIKQVAAETSIPLVMHGGSGISAQGFHTAIANGISKVNYFTYMSVAGAEGVADYLKAAPKAYYHEMTQAAMAAMKRDVAKAIGIFSM